MIFFKNEERAETIEQNEGGGKADELKQGEGTKKSTAPVQSAVPSPIARNLRDSVSTGLYLARLCSEGSLRVASHCRY